jgi:CxxC-x17-CxxC domain-containing protein
VAGSTDEIRQRSGRFPRILIARSLDFASILRDREFRVRVQKTDRSQPSCHVQSVLGPPGGRGAVTRTQEVPERVYEDRTLTCRDCSEEFIFSSGEQAFFSSKGLINDPQRCPSCRAAAKRARTTGGPREFHAAICGSCGGQAMVPFAPRNDRPVYCSTCFDKVRAGTLETPANA